MQTFIVARVDSILFTRAAQEGQGPSIVMLPVLAWKRLHCCV